MTKSWRDAILQEFTPDVARLTLAADPDQLLFDGALVEAIGARGFHLLPFEDPITFRYVYESNFRTHWDKRRSAYGLGAITHDPQPSDRDNALGTANPPNLVVVVPAAATALDTLPADLLQSGRKATFSLSELFPNLHYPVVASLRTTMIWMRFIRRSNSMHLVSWGSKLPLISSCGIFLRWRPN